MFKFVFSSLFNETPEYLDLYIANFLHYTESDVVLIVNLGRGVPVSLDRDFGPRVRLLRGEVQRSAFGHTLLAGHMESFAYAEDVFPDFGWFLTIASNSLFFRRFDGALTVADANTKRRAPDDHVMWHALPEAWHWQKFLGFEAAGARLRSRWGIDGLSRTQIEGSFASRKDWELVADVASDLTGYWCGLQAPLEEVLPLSVMQTLGSGRITHICKVKWVFPFRKELVRLEEMIDTRNLPDHVCMMKWFSRDPLAPETMIVGTSLGQALLQALQQAAPGGQADLNLEVLLLMFLGQVEARSRGMLVPFNPGRKLQETHRLPPLETIAARQICGIDGGAVEASEPYLYFEHTGARLELTLHFSGPRKLHIECRASPGQDDAVMPEGLQVYLYLPTPQARLLKLRGRVGDGMVERLVRKIIWKDIGYEIMPPFRWTVDEDGFVADYRLPESNQTCFLGLPIHAGLVLDVEVLWSGFVLTT